MNAKSFFWWLDVPRKIIWTPFWWLILSIAVFFIPVINVWWWLIIPILLVFPLETYYLWWIRWDFWYQKKKWVILELVPPKESLAPFKAMEDVFSAVWTIIDTANWRERWCEGEFETCPEWLSWEVASVEGSIHFYIRCMSGHRSLVESALYSHYPEVEITQVSDYTKNVPQNIPNKEWNIYGTEFILGKEDAYPIKTFSKFFEIGGEKISQEEKRIDPIVSLLEGMARLGPGEQLWFQMVTIPISDHDFPWREEGKKLISQIAKRPEDKKETLIDLLFQMFKELFAGFTGSAGSDEKGAAKSLSETKTESNEREMLLTPGERGVLMAVEEKMEKSAWKTTIRGVYIAKREKWDSGHRKTIESYLPHFHTQNMNHFKFNADTRTKVHFFMRKKRLLVRQRKMLEHYINRFPPFFPRWDLPGSSILNSEELATMYHFPTRITALIASTVVRVEAKKGGPPPNLPME